jgi:hypothetical protein
MRVLATCILALGLAVSPAMANSAAPGDNDSAATSSNTSTAAAQPANAPASAAKPDPAAKAEPSSMEVATELQQLRELLDAQAKQLQEQQQKMELLEEQLKASSAARENLAVAPADSESVSGASSAAIASNAALGGGSSDDKPGPPTSISFKGITLTPGGFMAAETVWRSKALAGDVNTPLNSAPFEGSSNAHISEFQASGRQSRISMLVEGKLDNVKIGGYYEADFLSAGTTSNPNQSNSYTLRQRQFWAQAAFNSGWTVTGGQMWSLLTETTHGMDNRTEALPQVIDAQYVAGFSWARQFGFRVVKSFDDNKLWLGFSIEEPQATLTAHGNPTATCAPANPTLAGPVTTGLCSAAALNGTRVTVPTAAGTSTAVILPNVYNNFLLGAFGTSGGLDNPLGNYQYNPSPDIIVKAVWEPGFGHYELGGIFSDFRDRVFPCVASTSTNPIAACGTLATSTTTAVTDAFSADGAYNDNRTGGGVFANARWNLLHKKVDVGIHFLGGDGLGRYGSVGLSDVTTRFVPEAATDPASTLDGTLAVIRSYQALGTLQLHPTPKLDINFYAGGEYAARTAYSKTLGGLANEGYGGLGLANWGCNTEVLPFAAQSTSASTGVPTSVAGGNGFIPGALQNCTGDTRNLIEGTVSFWYRFYKGPKGTVQFGMQYSNYVRNTWSGVASGTGADGITHTTNGAPHSDENMVFTSFRYVLP